MEAPYLKELESKRSAVSFGNRRLEAEYRAYVSRRSEFNVRRQLTLGALLLAGVTGLDFALLSEDFALRAVAARACFALPPIVAAFALTHVRHALWLRQVAGVLVAFGVGLTSLAIADLAASYDYPALAGGFIIVVFAYFFLGLHYVVAVTTGFSLVAGYVALALFSGVEATAIVYTGYNLLVMNVICAIGAGQLELARRRDFLKERLLSYRAGYDALSELANRSAFDTHLADSWKNARETRTALALLLIDIDHFKAYNDQYGHQAGDRVIQRVGQVLKLLLRRPEDFASRYGGEEFSVILADIDEDSAIQMAERIRERVLMEKIEHVRSATATYVTVSIGVAHLLPHESDRSEKGLLQMADEALYSAKELGRNRVVKAAVESSSRTGVFRLQKEAADGFAAPPAGTL
jgi:diguanylate cyclase (GGDEF)-like protein